MALQGDCARKEITVLQLIALQHAFDDAIEKKIREVEIIPGNGSGQLRKKVERFLQQPHIKPLYHRIENDSKNFGRLFIIACIMAVILVLLRVSKIKYLRHQLQLPYRLC